MSSVRLISLAVSMICLILALKIVMSSSSPKTFSAEKVHALKNDDLRSMIASGKSVIVLYHASWCGHCKRMLPMFNSVAQSMKNDTVFATIECASNPDAAREQKLKAFPCMRKYENGTQTNEILGALPSEDVLREALSEM